MGATQRRGDPPRTTRRRHAAYSPTPDGAATTANVGVTPSLTITAKAERARSLRPNKGEADQRRALGATYVRVDATAPNSPVVPAGAPAALLLPMPTVRVPTATA